MDGTTAGEGERENLRKQFAGRAGRDLYLAAYDISSRRRLAAALHQVRGHATGGQKSVYEIFLTPREKAELLAAMKDLLHETGDRFFLMRLDPHARTYTLGTAVAPSAARFFVVG